MRALFINLLLLGDVVNTAHVASAFKKYNKHWDVDLLTNLENRGIADLCNHFTEKHYINRTALIHEMNNPDRSVLEKYYIIQDELFDLLDCEYDLVINMTHNKLSSIISSLVKTKKRPGIFLGNDRKILIEDENGWMNYFNEFVANDEYNSFQYIDVFKSALNIPLNNERDLDVMIPGAKSSGFNLYEEDKFFIIKPTTSEENKEWGDENYIELGRLITEKTSSKCLVIGVDSERQRLKNIQNGIGAKAEVGVYPLSELKEKIEKSEFIIGGDTGVLHMAAAMKKKVITITIGPGTYFKSTPYGEGNIIIYPKENCYPCPHMSKCSRSNVCRQNVSPEVVFEAIFNNRADTPECGVLKTDFDDDGYLIYKNINLNKWDTKYKEMIDYRSVIKSFMNTQRQYNGFNSKELRATINKQC